MANERQDDRIEIDNWENDWYEPLWGSNMGNQGYMGFVIEISPTKGRITSISQYSKHIGASHIKSYSRGEIPNPESFLLYEIGTINGIKMAAEYFREPIEFTSRITQGLDKKIKEKMEWLRGTLI